jgi:hypothetical protein
MQKLPSRCWQTIIPPVSEESATAKASITIKQERTIDRQNRIDSAIIGRCLGGSMATPRH